VSRVGDESEEAFRRGFTGEFGLTPAHRRDGRPARRSTPRAFGICRVVTTWARWLPELKSN
jgi:hypothetical protein